MGMENMVVNALNHGAQYETLHAAFPKAFSFLRGTALESLSEGKIDIDGDRVFAIVSSGEGKGRKRALLEAHRAYIDIQVCIAGEDTIGLKETYACQNVASGYDSESDLIFYNDTPDDWVVLKPNTFAIFWPEHAHAPLAGIGVVKKIVVKVSV